MAEWFFRHLVADRADEFLVGSAGIAALDGCLASPQTLRVMREQEIDISSHRSRKITAEMAHAADKIFVMEVMHKEIILKAWPDLVKKVHLLAEYSSDKLQKKVEINIPDPIGLTDDFYNNVFEVISDCTRQVAAEMGVKKGDL
jgi:protein-tyrosine phosphatase